ncbi:hypothetical protein [Nocardia donostiensis]|uniref:IrrE N-terminal-like domain-containing protein n=1 Tax=Nocardia donostiensis TaxID=1538463 RepID=A0A1V2TJ45_9NOCA|nr:hypothetical protein [Nocardia donostiensis]ONM49371.1 hypothetical protein B0T46_08430 [Nocardia donostiensis]OQS14891.1 hypothetical protein B0T36_12690 [Nocardia donostiensis]OQS17596.1 hypothetical protein B0T44_23990 [Nocardia donostiensis]
MTSMETRFRDAAGTVPLPSPWDLNAYLAEVAAHRKRPVSLQPVHRSALTDIGCAGNGLWVARKYDDIIVYDASASGRNADHIVLHAVGHMLLGHGADPDSDATPGPEALTPALADALSSISPGSITQVLGRHEFGPEREQEAGVFAEMTMVYASLPRKRSRSFRLFGLRRKR